MQMQMQVSGLVCIEEMHVVDMATVRFLRRDFFSYVLGTERVGIIGSIFQEEEGQSEIWK